VNAVYADPGALTAITAAITLARWQWLEVQSGVPTIEAATAEQFVPQMLNFELVGGVDFRKGCYPGQEVVARSQYRGTVKRRMFLFDCAGTAAPGQEVFHSGDAAQPAGMVANAAPRPDGEGCSALVEVKLAALESGSLHLGAADGALLVRADLPYRVEVMADTA
jgi:folate-binding protein YgfZ